MQKPRLRGAARRAHGSSALVHAMRDLIASHAPLRGGTHKARPVSTKTLTPGDSRGRSPLARLSPLSFVVQRKMEPSGDRWFSRAASKNVKRKIPPPVDVGLAVRSVKPPHRFPCPQINQIPNPRSGGIEDQILHLADPGPEHILTPPQYKVKAPIPKESWRSSPSSAPAAAPPGAQTIQDSPQISKETSQRCCEKSGSAPQMAQAQSARGEHNG